VALVRIGKVVRAVGLGGHLGVGGSEGGLAKLSSIVLRRGEVDEAPRKVLEARTQGRIWAVKVEGISDRSAAERLVGAEVLGSREELGEAGEGKHYWTDLEGLAVVTVSGETVGRVTGLYETGGVDVLVVRGEGGAEKLVPLAPYVEVDAENGRIVVDPPDGLFD
jgi:16S rRNA processing protein RimM